MTMVRAMAKVRTGLGLGPGQWLGLVLAYNTS